MFLRLRCHLKKQVWELGPLSHLLRSCQGHSANAEAEEYSTGFGDIVQEGSRRMQRSRLGPQ